jgi:hydroxymethylbilane synthase
MSPVEKIIRVTSRGSALARAQTEIVRAHVEHVLPGVVCEVVLMTTTGDRQTQWTLQEHGGKGLFTKELEEALLDGRADLAVHSAKDLPTELPAGLALCGYMPRIDPRDILVRRADRPTPSLIASGSPRRREQGAKLWPNAKWTELRGNVETRLRKIAEGQADATILAAAGLQRLGIASYPGLVFEPVPVESMVPAAGQAAIAVECRTLDIARFSPLFDAKTSLAIGVERAVLAAFGGGCHSATAVHYDGNTLRIHLPNGPIWTTPLAAATLDEALGKLAPLVEQARISQQ